MTPKLPPNPQTQRLKTIILAGPLAVVSTLILYKRLYQGEPQRKLPSRDDPQAMQHTLFQEIQKDQIREIQEARHPRA